MREVSAHTHHTFAGTHVAVCGWMPSCCFVLFVPAPPSPTSPQCVSSRYRRPLLPSPLLRLPRRLSC